MCLFLIMGSHKFTSMVDFNNMGGDSSANNGQRFGTNGNGNGMYILVLHLVAIFLPGPILFM